MCEKVFIVRLLVMSVYFVLGKSTATLEFSGNGLVLVRDSYFEKIYEYQFNEPESLEFTCTLKGASGEYDLLLQKDIDFVGKRVNLPSPPEESGSISNTFKLTPTSKDITCIARDVMTDMSRFKCKVVLVYEEREAAPSTPTIVTWPRPDEQTEREPEPEPEPAPEPEPSPITLNDTSTTPVDIANLMSDGSTSNFWTRSTSILFLVTGIALVSIGFLTCVALHYRKRANKNRIPDNIINRPPLDLPSDIIYEEVYSHCRAFRNRGNETKKPVLPMHGLKTIKINQVAIPAYTGMVPIKRVNK